MAHAKKISPDENDRLAALFAPVAEAMPLVQERIIKWREVAATARRANDAEGQINASREVQLAEGEKVQLLHETKGEVPRILNAMGAEGFVNNMRGDYEHTFNQTPDSQSDMKDAKGALMVAKIGFYEEKKEGLTTLIIDPAQPEFFDHIRRAGAKLQAEQSRLF